VNLAAFPPYRRYTPEEAYTLGRQFLAELDFRFAARCGLRPLLRALFLEKRRQVITTPFFKRFLERETGEDLGALFNRYVYGRQDIEHPAAEPGAPQPSPAEAAMAAREMGAKLAKATKEEREKAPRAYSWQTLKQLL
jgi:hypothetical protein